MSNKKSMTSRENLKFSNSLRKSQDELLIIRESDRLQRFSKILNKYKQKNQNYYSEVQNYIATEKNNIEKRALISKKDIASKVNEILPKIEIPKDRLGPGLPILYEEKETPQLETHKSLKHQLPLLNNNKDSNKESPSKKNKIKEKQDKIDKSPYEKERDKYYELQKSIKIKQTKSIMVDCNNITIMNKTKNNMKNLSRSHDKIENLKSDKDESKEKIDLRKINAENFKKLFPNPLPPKDVSMKYMVGFENNGILVKNCLSLKNNWVELDLKDSTLFNFKWLATSMNIQFNKLGEFNSFKQLVNHFEFHSSISNKMNLFMNMLKYCEVHFYLEKLLKCI